MIGVPNLSRTKGKQWLLQFVIFRMTEDTLQNTDNVFFEQEVSQAMSACCLYRIVCKITKRHKTLSALHVKCQC